MPTLATFVLSTNQSAALSATFSVSGKIVYIAIIQFHQSIIYLDPTRSVFYIHELSILTPPPKGLGAAEKNTTLPTPIQGPLIAIIDLIPPCLK